MIGAVCACAISLGACGDDSNPKSAPPPHLGVSEAQASAITSADVEIFGARNATRNIVGDPAAVRRAEQLLKPLIVAKTLEVKPSNTVAGPLVQNLTSELDGTVPGLTTGDGSKERLDADAVHSFLRYGKKDPTRVFRAKAAQGVRKLVRLLHGKPASTIVSDIGHGETASHLVLSNVPLTRQYWPDLARRLTALNASLR
jgi:hypothetical protein